MSGFFFSPFPQDLSRLYSGALFCGVGLSFARCRSLADGASQLRFCLGQEDAAVYQQSYETLMEGDARLKKLSLGAANHKFRLMAKEQIGR